MFCHHLIVTLLTWRSRSLMLVKGSGVGATDCTGTRLRALASSAWFSNSRKSGSLLKWDCSGRPKSDGHHGRTQGVL